ncbi:MAG: ATP-binding protein [Nitrospirae bacterium]|nr:ATP-binding protein [Nitrospirota bacterium]
MFDRHITESLLDGLADTPVVMLHGARQTGKSTLAQWVAARAHPARYLTLDDAGVLAAARHDPAGFLAGLGGPVVLDEVQRAPELFLAIKAQVDRDRQPGRYLLTGSANVVLLPLLSESLAGRMETLALWPLSQGEIEERREGFVDAVFARTLPSMADGLPSRSEIVRRIVRGGYPEVLSRTAESRRSAWFSSYITTILQRDVRDLANIEGLTALPRLLALLSARVMALLNFAELSRSISIPLSTLKRYMALLETAFLIHMLPAWSGNLGKRLVKAPKLLFSDVGLAAHLLGVNAERLARDLGLFGQLLENFVTMELRKQITWSQVHPQMFHFRTQTGQEVDLVLEDQAGRIVGIEVKASATVSAQDFKGLRSLAEAVGKRFRRGIVLCTGSEAIPFGPHLHALPVSALWRLGAERDKKAG